TGAVRRWRFGRERGPPPVGTPRPGGSPGRLGCRDGGGARAVPFGSGPRCPGLAAGEGGELRPPGGGPLRAAPAPTQPPVPPGGALLPTAAPASNRPPRVPPFPLLRLLPSRRGWRG